MNNTTPFSVNDYDGNVRSVIPFYDIMHEQILELASVYFGDQPIRLLDTGCGSGTFVEKALQQITIQEAVLCDPSESMLQTAKEKLAANKTMCQFFQIGSQDLPFSEKFDLVTAIQSHHYFQPVQRKQALQRCFQALKPGGLFVTFENTAPDSETGKQLLLKRLEYYGLTHGRTEEAVKSHSQRYGTEFFPITVKEQCKQLKESGFSCAEVFWHSYLQVGFYAVKA